MLLAATISMVMQRPRPYYWRSAKESARLDV
jgi:hypothetical protein